MTYDPIVHIEEMHVEEAMNIIVEPDRIMHYEEAIMSTPPLDMKPILVEDDGEPLTIVEVSNNRVSTNSESGGHIAYKIPTEMTVRSTYQVIVRISKSVAHIYENLNGEVHTSTVPITETMEVKVVDPSPSDHKMFEIIPDNQPTQLVENNENVTQWTFNVTPLRAGKSKLKVVVSIIRNGVSKEVVYEDYVTVKTDITKTIPYFIATYWQWLLTTIVIPVIVWFVKRRKKDEDEKTN